MKKTLMIIVPVVAVLGIVIGYLYFYHPELLTFATMAATETPDEKVYTLDTLEPGRYYVWNNNGEDILDSVNGNTDSTFHILPEGNKNWEKKQDVNHTIWFSSKEDESIPTYYQGDELIYVSKINVPFEGIKWERFADYGYTIGVTNLIGDKSGHYRIPFDENKLYAGYVYDKSDASQINQFVNVSNIFIDKIGGVSVRDSIISDGGTIYGLEKDNVYVCEWYTGTFYQDFEMTADIHSFCSFESFKTYNYNFLHSNCISIEIPNWFKSGYYYVNELGFFRYVSDADRNQYNGQAYDGNIEWNDPIILYNDLGQILYDPSNNIDKRYVDDNSDTTSIQAEQDNQAQLSGEDNTFENDSYKEQTDHFDYDIPSDSGAEDDAVN